MLVGVGVLVEVGSGVFVGVGVLVEVGSGVLVGVGVLVEVGSGVFVGAAVGGTDCSVLSVSRRRRQGVAVVEVDGSGLLRPSSGENDLAIEQERGTMSSPSW
ncbi:MAG: hypothetical protein R2845_15285 [Thermomicrobiales bacterium]